MVEATHVPSSELELLDAFDAQTGDVVIVPAGAWHAFTNSGTGKLQHTAIHEAPAQASTFRSESDTPL